MPGWQVANDGNITVALDVTVTPELRNEGMARELINRIQNIRKASEFDITDKVDVVISGNEGVKEAVEAFGDYISAQVLASSIRLEDELEGADITELDIDGTKVLARVNKI